MKAITFRGERRLTYEEVDDPRIVEPTDAIVRIELAAVCGSDLHVYHGRERGLDSGTVMGHEFVGEVVERGPGAASLAVGTKVFCPFTTSCGACYFCRTGLTSRCESGQLFGWVEAGAGLHGGQAEQVRVPLAASSLMAIPADLSPEIGLLLGDVLSTGWFCAEQAGIEPGGIYVVLGCGPVGLCAILAARELGAEQMYAVDRVPERLELARRLGATTIDLDGEDPLSVVLDATAGRGADAVLEGVGNEPAHRLAYDLLRPGGTISVVGMHTEARFAFTPAETYDKNLTYRVGRCPARRMMEQLLPRVRSLAADPAAIITHRLPLADGVEAYRIFDEKRDGCVKVVLKP